MGYPYLMTFCPSAISVIATLCPNGISDLTVISSPSREQTVPDGMNAGATAALSAGEILINNGAAIVKSCPLREGSSAFRGIRPAGVMKTVMEDNVSIPYKQNT